jgi:hypothetical protein
MSLKKAQDEIHSILEKDDIRWRQRSRVNWLQQGDKNTKFYHACANKRQSLNKINSIRDESGRLWESQGNVGEAYVDYFSNLFSTGGVGDVDKCLEVIDVRVIEAMNEVLLKPFVEEEVWTTLFQMAPLKALGSDGLNAGFFQKKLGDCWSERFVELFSTL